MLNKLGLKQVADKSLERRSEKISTFLSDLAIFGDNCKCYLWPLLTFNPIEQLSLDDNLIFIKKFSFLNLPNFEEFS